MGRCPERFRFRWDTWDERFATAQADIVARCSEIVFFPSGTYVFANTVRLESHGVVRGVARADARSRRLAPATGFVSPKYQANRDGEGTARDWDMPDPTNPREDFGHVHESIRHQDDRKDLHRRYRMRRGTNHG
jgi:hypothetical protein